MGRERAPRSEGRTDFSAKAAQVAGVGAPASQLAVLMPSLSARDRDALASHFKGRRLSPGEVLWKQNDPATSIVVVAAGALVSTLEDVDEEVSAGQMCGESAALTKARRASTVACSADGPSQIYVLGAIALAALPAELKLELALLSMRYMSHRLDPWPTGSGRRGACRSDALVPVAAPTPLEVNELACEDRCCTGGAPTRVLPEPRASRRRSSGARRRAGGGETRTATIAWTRPGGLGRRGPSPEGACAGRGAHRLP